MGRITLMQEPLGLLVAMIADYAGIADVSLKLLICALGAASLGVGFHLKDREPCEERYGSSPSQT